MIITKTQNVELNKYICEVCKKRRGIGFNHFKCSKILQERYRDASPVPQPAREGVIKAYKSVYERF